MWLGQLNQMQSRPFIQSIQLRPFFHQFSLTSNLQSSYLDDTALLVAKGVAGANAETPPAVRARTARVRRGAMVIQETK